MSTTEQDLTGRTLGHYKLEKVLGKPGASGCTYRARHGNKLFAIKTLHRDATKKDKARFKREGELLASLDHPNIERVVDFDYDGNYQVHYIVKNFVKGTSLESVLQARKKKRITVTPKETLEVVGQIALALAHVHARQDIPGAPADRILHLDLKPSNILVGCQKDDSLERKKAWLIDFGHAVWGMEGERRRWGLGTNPYRSPEHIKGGPFTRQTDVYQLGFLLYEMLTGRCPIDPRDLNQADKEILERPPSPATSSNPKLPTHVNLFFARALAKHAKKRFSSVEQMFEALLAIFPRVQTRTFREILSGPSLPPPQLVRGTDGVRIAVTRKGVGPPLVYPPAWVTHQGIQWANPRLRSFFEKLTKKAELISYDRRGCGLSDHQVRDLSWKAQLRDLDAVIKHCRLRRVGILGISAAGPLAISYAALHPKKVSKLILYGTFARLRGHASVPWRGRFIDHVRTKWGYAARQLNEIFIPGASEDERNWLSFFQRASSSGDKAARFALQIQALDVRKLARQVRCPTLIIHRSGDKAIPFTCAEELAPLINGAKLITDKEGVMHPPWSGNSQPILRPILRFLREKTKKKQRDGR